MQEKLKVIHEKDNERRRQIREQKRKADPDYELKAEELRKSRTEKAMATKRAKAGGQFKVDILRAAEQGDPEAVEQAKVIRAEEY